MIVCTQLFCEPVVTAIAVPSCFGCQADGSSIPDWVPANAKIHIDLVGGTPQGRAWVQGIGEVAVDTLLGSDPNTNIGWHSTSYDPANLMSDGYYGNGVRLVTAFIGAARSKIFNGCTGTIKLKDPTSCTASITVIGLASGDGTSGLEIDLEGGSPDNKVNAYSWNGAMNLTLPDIVNISVVGALNTVAFTLTQTRIDFAVNGSSALTASLTTDDYPVEGDSALVAALFDQTQDREAVQSITFYDPLPDTTGLSALSEI